MQPRPWPIDTRREAGQVISDPEGPLTIIGEKINPSEHHRLAAALQAGEVSTIRELAAPPVDAGADVLDADVGQSGIDEIALLPRGVQEAQ